MPAPSEPRRRVSRAPSWRAAAALLGALVTCSPQGAAAYEDQTLLGLDLSYVLTTSAGPLPAHGLGLGATLGWGLDDTLTLQGRLGYALQPAATSAHLLEASVELVYMLDVLQLVPFFGLGLDAVGFVRDGEFALAPLGHLLVGLDYLIDREWVAGLDLRAHLRPHAFAEPDPGPFLLTIGLRISRVFDRF